MQNNRKIIGTNINSALALRDKTQKELAEHLNVKPNVISYFCNGERTPNTEQLIQISKYLNVSADFLLGLQKNPTLNEDYQNAEELTGLSETAIINLNQWSKNPFTNKSFSSFCELLENNSIVQISKYLQRYYSYTTKYTEKASQLLETNVFSDLTLEELEDSQISDITKDLIALDKECNLIEYEMNKYIIQVILKQYDMREINTELKLDNIIEKLNNLSTDQKGE